MKYLLLVLFCLWLPICARAAELSVAPSRLAPGEVSLLRWRGTSGATGEVEFNGRTFALQPTVDGGMALLGTDLDTVPGDYPVRVRQAGSAERCETKIRVVAASRQEERISLPEQMVSPQAPEILQRIEQERAMLKEIFARQTANALPAGFRLPVADPIGSPFGLRRILNGQPKSPHAGIDFRSPLGTPVFASAAGVVAYAGELYYTGLTVVIDHGGGLFSLYCHLAQIDCTVGNALQSGERLGRVGSTGRSTGAHLHWGVKLRGDRVDPLALTSVLNGKKP